MPGRFLSQYDMKKAKFEQQMWDLHLKRGKVKDADRIVRTHHVVCGCSAPGCIFISAQRKSIEQ